MTRAHSFSRTQFLDRPPWSVRLKLAWHRRVDLTACWLVEHDHHKAAVRLWSLFRMWTP